MPGVAYIDAAYRSWGGAKPFAVLGTRLVAPFLRSCDLHWPPLISPPVEGPPPKNEEPPISREFIKNMTMTMTRPKRGLPAYSDLAKADLARPPAPA